MNIKFKGGFFVQKRILIFQIIGAIVSIGLGVIFHYTYNWSGKNEIIAAFTAVNESTWEHLKLAFFPMLIMAVVGYFVIGKEANNYIESKAKAIVFAITFITVVFYTYNGVIGKDSKIFNILLFIFSVIIGESIAYINMIKKDDSTKESKAFSILIIFALLISFITFTYNTPKLNLFKDPIYRNIWNRRVIIIINLIN